MANTFTTAGSDPNVGGVYPQQWETKLQERLDRPTTWKEVCDVRFSDINTINMPYMSTEFTAQSGTRGTAYSFSDFTITNDQLRITSHEVVPVFIDRADLAQFTLLDYMEIADRQGSVIAERLETLVLANHAAWTDFDNASIGGAAGNITVSATNIDDIIRGIKRELGENNGQMMADRQGIFIVWRYADLELLEQFAQANGFTLADAALKDGLKTGYYFMNVYHYVSNNHTAGHLFAGVKKIQQLGLLRTTWGRPVQSEEPSNADGPLSGTSVTARFDYGLNVPTAHVTLVFDVLVA